MKKNMPKYSIDTFARSLLTLRLFPKNATTIVNAQVCLQQFLAYYLRIFVIFVYELFEVNITQQGELGC